MKKRVYWLVGLLILLFLGGITLYYQKVRAESYVPEKTAQKIGSVFGQRVEKLRLVREDKVGEKKLRVFAGDGLEVRLDEKGNVVDFVDREVNRTDSSQKVPLDIARQKVAGLIQKIAPEVKIDELTLAKAEFQDHGGYSDYTFVWEKKNDNGVVIRSFVITTNAIGEVESFLDRNVDVPAAYEREKVTRQEAVEKVIEAVKKKNVFPGSDLSRLEIGEPVKTVIRGRLVWGIDVKYPCRYNERGDEFTTAQFYMVDAMTGEVIEP